MIGTGHRAQGTGHKADLNGSPPGGGRGGLKEKSEEHREI